MCFSPKQGLAGNEAFFSSPWTVNTVDCEMFYSNVYFFSNFNGCSERLCELVTLRKDDRFGHPHQDHMNKFIYRLCGQLTSVCVLHLL